MSLKSHDFPKIDFLLLENALYNRATPFVNVTRPHQIPVIVPIEVIRTNNVPLELLIYR